METRQLAGTEVTTTVLGFGCAGIFHLASSRARRGLLETAREVGIGHFDVAPTYGLGRAEAELASILADDRARLTVTTKFGLELTAAGRAAGWLQAPVRAALARRPALQNKMAGSGRSAEPRALGRILYAAAADPATARRGLQRSLRALQTVRIDVFAVHEPAQTLVVQPDGLAEELDRMRGDGAIRCWAVAGESPASGTAAAMLFARAPVVQRRDDVFSDPPVAGRASITYGAFARAIPALAAYLRREPHAIAVWSERLQADLADPAALPTLLLRQAVRRNPRGVVLFSTVRPDRIRAAVAAVTDGPDGPNATAEAEAMTAFVATAKARGAAPGDT